MTDIPVEIWQLVRDGDDMGKDVKDVILLRDERGRILPIVIGVCEAAAIWVRLTPEAAEPYLRRPWSHDLIQHLLERLDAKLERVVVDGFTNDTFFATLHLTHHGQEQVVDARPSDAIALALRLFAPILVNEEVMEEASIIPGDDGDGSTPYEGAP